MRACCSLGTEWNTSSAHLSLVRPSVRSRAGTIIEPLNLDEAKEALARREHKVKRRAERERDRGGAAKLTASGGNKRKPTGLSAAAAVGGGGASKPPRKKQRESRGH